MISEWSITTQIYAAFQSRLQAVQLFRSESASPTKNKM